MQITAKAVPLAKQRPEVLAPNEKERISASYFLTLSAAASGIELNANAGLVKLETNSSGIYSGIISIDSRSPVAALKVVWKKKEAAHRFAKLVIEAEGEATFTHVFDGAGDINDFVELPF